MSEDKQPTATQEDKPEGLTPEAITANPELTIKELKALRSETSKKNDVIKDLNSKFETVASKLAAIEAEKKTAEDAKLIADGKYEELSTNLSSENSTLKSELEAKAAKLLEYEAKETARLEGIQQEKLQLIEEIKMIDPTVADVLDVNMTLKQLRAFKATGENKKPGQAGAKPPIVGQSGDVKPDYSGMSAYQRKMAQIRDLSK